MNLLLVERKTDSTRTLIESLVTGAAVRLIHSESQASSLREFLKAGGAIDLAIIAVEWNAADALAFIKTIRAAADKAHVRHPQFLVLHSRTLQLPYDVVQLRRAARCLRRSSTEQIVEEILQLSLEIRVRRFPVLIRFRRPGNTLEAEIVGEHPASLVLGGQLTRACHFFGLHPAGFATEALADALGIHLQTAKTYIKDLRDEVERVRDAAGILQHGEDIFCTIRRAGGTVHKLNADVEWDF